MQDKNSLAHTQWRCKYHIVFAPEYRRQIIYESKKSIGEITRESLKEKGLKYTGQMHIGIIFIC